LINSSVDDGLIVFYAAKTFSYSSILNELTCLYFPSLLIILLFDLSVEQNHLNISFLAVGD